MTTALASTKATLNAIPVRQARGAFGLILELQLLFTVALHWASGSK